LRGSVRSLAPPFATAPESALAEQLGAARRIIEDVEIHPPAGALSEQPVSPEFERIRWFPLPGDGLTQLRARSEAV